MAGCDTAKCSNSNKYRFFCRIGGIVKILKNRKNCLQNISLDKLHKKYKHTRI